jgi:adenylyltransferase/sulfurtransferase
MKIEIPTPLRAYTGNQASITVAADTISQAVTTLLDQYPDFRKHLYTPDGKLRSFVNLYLNDEDVRYLPEREETKVKDSDTLSIIPSIAGGSLAGTGRPGGRASRRTAANAAVSVN